MKKLPLCSLVVLMVFAWMHALQANSPVEAEEPDLASGPKVTRIEPLRGSSPPRSPSAYGWQVTTLESPRGFCCLSDRSLRLDADGSPHIAYGSRQLYHTFWDSAQWQYEVVDPSIEVGKQAYLVLDADGFPHISYYDEANDDIKYAHWDGSQWRTDVVEDGDVQIHSAIGVDSLGRPHIAYHDGTEYLLRYAYWDGSQWRKEIVDSDPRSGFAGVSLMVGEDDVVHIAYNHAWDDALKYARRDGAWQVYTIDGVGPMGTRHSLILDSSGAPHIIYETSDYANQVYEIKHAFWDGSEWQIETVLSGSDQNFSLSAAIDSEDYLHVVYEGEIDNQSALKYVYQEGSGWQPPEVVLNDDVTGLSAAIDPNDLMQLVYLYGGDLVYQVQDSSGWQAPLVLDHEVSFGYDLDFDLDEQGDAHISYYEAIDDDLRYAYQDDGAWYRTIFQSSQDIGRYNSIALYENLARIAYYTEYRDGSLYLIYLCSDGTFYQEFVDGLTSSEDRGKYNSMAIWAGARRLSYYDDSAGCLDYAFKSTGSWYRTALDCVGDVGLYTSLALDGGGDAHISYSDDTNDWLKYIHQADGAWQDPELVADAGYVGRFAGWTSIAVESDGDAHISYEYEDGDLHEIRYIYQIDGVWQPLAVVGPATRAHSTLALDGSGYPHIAFEKDGELVHVHKDISGWQAAQVVDAGGGYLETMVLDDEGYPRIAYISAASLKYAVATEAVPPVADFTAAPTSGPAPLAVQFTNTSSGWFTECHWDFGDDQGSGATDPSHTYADPGVYTVTLTVSGGLGEDTETKARFITVYAPVVADFTANPTFGFVPQAVQFANHSSGEFDTISWDFGDGAISEQFHPVHTYTASNTYTVTLSVNGLGGSDELVRANYIRVVEPVAAIYLPVVLKH